MMTPGEIIEGLALLGALIAFLMRIENRFTRVETKIEDIEKLINK